MPVLMHPAVEHVAQMERLWSNDPAIQYRAHAIVIRLINAGFIQGRVHNGELAVLLDEPVRERKTS